VDQNSRIWFQTVLLDKSNLANGSSKEDLWNTFMVIRMSGMLWRGMPILQLRNAQGFPEYNTQDSTKIELPVVPGDFSSIWVQSMAPYQCPTAFWAWKEPSSAYLEVLDEVATMFLETLDGYDFNSGPLLVNSWDVIFTSTIFGTVKNRFSLNLQMTSAVLGEASLCSTQISSLC
jgi:hypothetical protein